MSDCAKPRGEHLAVMQRIAVGMTYRQIAWELWLSEAAVQARVRSLCRDLGVCSRQEALAICVREGWI